MKMPAINPHSATHCGSPKIITLMTDEEMRERRNPVEIVQSAACATAEDAAQIVREQWPDLWAQIISAGRANGLRPIPMMLHAIREGLGA